MKATISIFIAMLFSYSVLADTKKTETEASKWLSGWEKERSEGPINSECRQHTSKIKQCKFTAIVDESVESLSAVVLDLENFKDWAVSVKVSDIVTYPNDSDLYVYTTYEFVGAYNRDALTRYTPELDLEKNAIKIKFITVDKEIETSDLRLVRFPLMAGYWQFRRLSNGKTEIEHLSFALPGGVVQKALYPLYNIGYLDSSFETIRALQKQSLKPQYQSANFASLNLKN
jgi:hypothetical protein